jgi:hypothetical protein
MSDQLNGSTPFWVKNGQTKTWSAAWLGAGWPGCVLLQPQPLDDDASLQYVEQGPVVFDKAGGTYTFQFSFKNLGPKDTWYNIQGSGS